MRDNDNRGREPFGLGSGSGVVRVAEYTRTEAQVSSHEGFAPEAIWVRDDEAVSSEAPPTMRLAVPPPWAQRDDLPCTKRVPKGNQPDPYDTNSTKAARKLCAGCPVTA